MKSPYVYFGGKRKIAAEVWRRFGHVDTYVEPFFGSGAVLLAMRQDPPPASIVVNDLDCMIVNFWRALQSDPDAVAYHADWPTTENDLHARHAWLVSQKPNIVAKMEGDPDYCDARVAGWWVWGMANWIGAGFASGAGGWQSVNGELVRNNGQGVNRQLPHVGDNDDDGELFPRNGGLYAYIRELADFMRGVRVICGDWRRVVTPSVTWAGEQGTAQATCGMFLDPPYTTEAGRDMNVYTHDDGDVAHDVREWCIANGRNRNMRIALCGYDNEHVDLEALGWSVYEWKAGGGYGEAQNKGRGSANRKRERVWFSPHCNNDRLTLFEV